MREVLYESEKAKLEYVDGRIRIYVKKGKGLSVVECDYDTFIKELVETTRQVFKEKMEKLIEKLWLMHRR